MSLRLIIEDGIGQIRAALLRDGRAIEIWLAGDSEAPALDAVYRGRVARLHEDTQSADIDLGGGQPAMLAFRHAPRQRLQVGAGLLVQVRREAIMEGAGLKAPVLTGRPALKGRYLGLAADGQTTRLPAAAQADAAAIAAEEARLRADWAAALAADKPGLALAPPGPLERLLAHHAPPGLDAILIDSTALLAQARQLAQSRYPDLLDRIAPAPHGSRLFDAHGVEDDLEAVMSGTVDLGQGAFLRIETTDALTAIDVNSGPLGQGRGHAGMAAAVNARAAGEVARQLRLQDIGGLVVVDFLDLHGRAARAALEAAYDAAAKDDPAAWQRSRLSPFGTMEIIRARHGPSLAQRLLTRPRPRPRAEVQALALLRQALREAESGPPGALVLTLDSAAAALLDSRPQWAHGLAARTGRAIIRRAAPPGQPSQVHIASGHPDA